MKNIILYIATLLLLTSCEEVIDVDLDTGKTRLVIDAKAERIHNPSGEITQEIFVNLSLSTAFFETQPSFVNDAIVTITDLSSGILFPLSNNPSVNGQYAIFGSTGLEIQDGNEYLLTINYNEEIYESIEVINPSVPIDNLFQFKNNNAFSDPEDVAINITYKDIEGIGNNYIFSFDNINFLATDDEFIIDGESFSFDYFYEDPQENLIVSILGSDELANNYVDSIVELSEGGNGPFQTVPFEVKGNIVNTTNEDNYPYGYFRINEVYFSQIELIDNEDAPEKEDILENL